MYKVAMFVTNPCTHDARVIKEAETLASVGFSVRIYAAVTTRAESGIFEQNGYSIERILVGGLISRIFSQLSSTFRRARRQSVSKVENNLQTPSRVNAVETPKNNQIHSQDKPRNFKNSRLGQVVVAVLAPARKFLIYYYFCNDASKSASLWGVQIAHCHDLSTLYAGKILKNRSAELKVVYDSHELWVHRNRVGRKAWLEQWLDSVAEKHLIKFSDKVITVCDSIGKWLSDSYPNISMPVVVRNMPNFFNSEMNGAPTIKTRLGIPEDKFVLIYTGKITSGRGIELGARALVSDANLHLVLLGYGDSSYVNTLKQEIDQIGVSNQVTFCDAVAHDEVASFIHGADLALVCIEPVCLSYEYALPNKLFESIQAGIPILGSELVEIKKIVAKYDIGICFKSQNDMVSKLNSLSGEQLGRWRHNISSCKEALSWNTERSKLIALYRGFFV